eukprot:scaffold43125_cov57-Phaeocystis_antarctica.AAC.2
MNASCPPSPSPAPLPVSTRVQGCGVVLPSTRPIPNHPLGRCTHGSGADLEALILQDLFDRNLLKAVSKVVLRVARYVLAVSTRCAGDGQESAA